MKNPKGVTARKKHDKLLPNWKPGQSGNPNGRPKGSRHKLEEDFLRALAEDFDAHGVVAITAMRDGRPGDYVKMIASLMPREATININAYDELTDEQLYERFRILQGEIAAFLPDGGSVTVSGRNQKKTEH